VNQAHTWNRNSMVPFRHNLSEWFHMRSHPVITTSVYASSRL